jgi:mRNA-degrading endonuclease toxin of MazEF toxin-antitoxin module
MQEVTNESKDFDKWNEVKKIIDYEKCELFFKERDIFWMKVGENIGHEQNGKGDKFQRPVLVIKKYSKDMFLGVPLTSTMRDGSFFFQFELDGSMSTALLVQHKLFSSKRCMKKIGKIDSENFKKLKEKLINLIS